MALARRALEAGADGVAAYVPWLIRSAEYQVRAHFLPLLEAATAHRRSSTTSRRGQGQRPRARAGRRAGARGVCGDEDPTGEPATGAYLDAEAGGRLVRSLQEPSRRSSTPSARGTGSINGSSNCHTSFHGRGWRSRRGAARGSRSRSQGPGQVPIRGSSQSAPRPGLSWSGEVGDRLPAAARAVRLTEPAGRRRPRFVRAPPCVSLGRSAPLAKVRLACRATEPALNSAPAGTDRNRLHRRRVRLRRRRAAGGRARRGPALAQVLVARLGAGGGTAFLAADAHQLDAFAGLRDAAAVILDHVGRRSRITVHGDYDVDGIAATEVLVRACDRWAQRWTSTCRAGSTTATASPPRPSPGSPSAGRTCCDRRLRDHGSRRGGGRAHGRARGRGDRSPRSARRRRLPAAPIVHPAVGGYPCADLAPPRSRTSSPRRCSRPRARTRGGGRGPRSRRARHGGRRRAAGRREPPARARAARAGRDRASRACER